MAPPARVLWLIKGLGLGGAERLLTSTAALIDRSRFDVEVVYLLARSGDFEPTLEAYGVPTLCLEARWTVESAWPRRLVHILRTERFDLVHTHSPVPASAARLFAPRRTRFIHTEHNVWSSYRRPTYIANAMTYRRNQRVLAVSDAVAASIEPRWWCGPSRWQPQVETLHHGVDLRRISRGPEARSAARDALSLADEALVVGTVGNLTAQKDHAGLITAFEMVHRRHPAATLLIMGSGPLENELRGQAEASGLQQAVRFLGSRPDVLALLPGLDLFVLGSRYEGLPIALLEAMASGIPAVATRVGGVAEAVRDGVEGLLVEPRDPHSLAEAMAALLNDASERARLAAAATARIETDFSIDRAVQRIEEVYTQALGEGV